MKLFQSEGGPIQHYIGACQCTSINKHCPVTQPTSVFVICSHRTMAANSATVRILIKGGKVVNDDFTQEADVYIENGIIQQVGRELMIPGGAKVIDATGKLVIPGGIDTSTHLQQTFMNATTVDDFYSGTKVSIPCWRRSAITSFLVDSFIVYKKSFCFMLFAYISVC